MSVEYNFFKDDSPTIKGWENQIMFFIDNYSSMLHKHRVIKAQNERIKRRKETAHKDLEELRRKKAEINKSKIKLSDAEKLELQEREEFLVAMREANDIVYYYGEHMTYDESTILILKYQKIMDFIDMIDCKVRGKIAPKIKTLTSYVTRPVLSIVRSKIDSIKNQETRYVLRYIRDVLKGIPEVAETSFMCKSQVNLKDHIPE